MATLIADVRSGLATALATTGVRADGYVGMGQPPIPCFRVAVNEFDPRVVFRNGKARMTFTVVAFAGLTADRAGEKLLDKMADLTGTNSVLAAVETSSNWGSTVIDFAAVTRIGEIQVTDIGGAQYLTREFDVDVAF